MASSSLAPIRRFKTSSRPTVISNIHFPLTFTSGIGNGKSSLPTVRMARFGFLESAPTAVFSFAFPANATALFLSATGSSELRMSLLSGPRISVKAAISNDSAAWRRLSAASFGVLNCFWFDCVGAGASFLASGAARNENATAPDITIAQASKEILNEFMMFDFSFTGFELFIAGARLHRHLVRHRRVRHRHVRHRLLRHG